MNLIKLNCNSCNAPLELDLDNMQAYCPYCGNKLMFDVDQIGLIYAEREKTKRVEIVENEKTKRKLSEFEHDTKSKRFKGSLLAFILLVIVISAAVYYGHYSVLRRSHEKEHYERVAYLEQLETEIDAAIMAGDYVTARLKANKLYCDDGWSYDESSNWDRKRWNYIDMIDEKEEQIAEEKREQEKNNPDNIYMPSSSKDFKGLDYEDVMRQLRALGFTNVSSQPATEPAGLFKKKNTVEHILVGDVTKFSEKDYFLKDTKIIVYYYVKK